MRTGIIYCAVFPSGKKYYGRTIQSLTKRKYHHYSCVRNGSNLYFHNAIRKYGEDNFNIFLIETYDNSEESVLAEMRLIADLKAYSNGYNSSKGGLGEYRTEESYRMQSCKMKGKKKSKNHINKVATALREGYRSGRLTPYMKGKKMSQEQKKNMIGKKKSRSSNKTLKGSKVMEHTRQICFYSLRDAGVFFKINGTSIARSITNNKTCKQLKFTYI